LGAFTPCNDLLVTVPAVLSAVVIIGKTAPPARDLCSHQKGYEYGQSMSQGIWSNLTDENAEILDGLCGGHKSPEMSPLPRYARHPGRHRRSRVGGYTMVWLLSKDRVRKRLRSQHDICTACGGTRCIRESWGDWRTTKQQIISGMLGVAMLFASGGQRRPAR